MACTLPKICNPGIINGFKAIGSKKHSKFLTMKKEKILESP